MYREIIESCDFSSTEQRDVGAYLLLVVVVLFCCYCGLGVSSFIFITIISYDVFEWRSMSSLYSSGMVLFMKEGGFVPKHLSDI